MLVAFISNKLIVIEQYIQIERILLLIRLVSSNLLANGCFTLADIEYLRFMHRAPSHVSNICFGSNRRHAVKTFTYFHFSSRENRSAFEGLLALIFPFIFSNF